MDRALLEMGSEYEQLIGRDVAEFSSEGCDGIHIVVSGAHLRGMALNWQLTGRGGRLVSTVSSADCYRMYPIPAGAGLPERPALIRVADGKGIAIGVETWAQTSAAFGDFVDAIPAPLGIGKIITEGGEITSGFIAEPIAANGARDISSSGGWRSWMNRDGS
jgi:allophanate hydrolase